MKNVSKWMSWETGVDLAALTSPDGGMPNIIVHLGRTVHTPAGSAPSGMILYQPNGAAAPAVMGFVSSDEQVGTYFGPHIFAGTPFEQAPVLKADIRIETTGTGCYAKCLVGDYTFEVEMSDLGDPYLIQREPGGMTPFTQQGVEQAAGSTILKVNGEVINITIPPVGIAGGPAAVVSPNGVYAR